MNIGQTLPTFHPQINRRSQALRQRSNDRRDPRQRPQDTKTKENLNVKTQKGKARKVARVPNTPRVTNLLGSKQIDTLEIGNQRL